MEISRPRPKISVIVIFHNMRREARRTLFSLSAAYQQNVDIEDYEVIAIDNGSSRPLAEADVQAYGQNFHYVFLPTSSVSPVGAVNAGVAAARADRVVICIDGARILSPRVLFYSLTAFRAFDSPFVCTLGWHVGEEVQNISVTKGYNQAREDQLLESVPWRSNGYTLFSISSLALSCKEGWFSPIAESNCFAIGKQEFLMLGGFHAGFQSPGGGLVNLDFFSLACEAAELQPVVLLGEGTFHQFHGGVATNVPLPDHPWSQFEAEYVRVRARAYAAPQFRPHYLGHLPREAHPFLARQP